MIFGDSSTNAISIVLMICCYVMWTKKQYTKTFIYFFSITLLELWCNFYGLIQNLQMISFNLKTMIDVIGYIQYRIRYKILSYLDCGLSNSVNGLTTVYFYSGPNKYAIKFKNKRGGCRFSSIIDQKLNDVTDVVKQYAGPYYDFYGIDTKVEDLNYDGLTVYMLNGNVVNLNISDRLNGINQL